MNTVQSTQSAGAWLIVTHKVEDFARWQPVFESTAQLKSRYGWKQSSVFAVDGDRNNVMVMEQFDSLEHAQAFAGSTELKAAMGKAGVVGKPEVHFVNSVANSQP